MSSNGGGIKNATEMTASSTAESTTPYHNFTVIENLHSNSTNSAHHQGKGATNNRLKVCTSWVVAATIALLVFVCAVLSKTAFMSIATRLYIGNTTSSTCNDVELIRQQSVAFVQLMIVLCIPQAFTALRTLFFGVLGTQENFPWPSVWAFALVSGS